MTCFCEASDTGLQIPLDQNHYYNQSLVVALGIGTDFLRVFHCPNPRLAPNDSHEEYGQLAARTSGQYLSGRHVIMILLCCLDFSGRHIVPQVAVKSSCAQPAQKG